MGLLQVCLVLLAALALTGAGLMCFYVPAVTITVAAGTGHKAISVGGVLRGTHFWASLIIGPLLFLHLLVSLARRNSSGGKPKRVVIAGWLLLLLTAVLWFTGLLLPWDELSFWLIALGHGRGIHLTLLQIYWLHVALLPIVAGAILFYYVQGYKKGMRPLSPMGTVT